jgi:hypothetical protein
MRHCCIILEHKCSEYFQKKEEGLGTFDDVCARS